MSNQPTTKEPTMTTTTAAAERYAAAWAAAEARFAARESGVWRTFFTDLRLDPEAKATHVTFSAIRRNRKVAVRYAKGCKSAQRYTDRTLEAIVAAGEPDAGPGTYREAVILLTVAPEHRTAVVAEAHTFRNATPDAGRWSDALRTCAHRYGGR